MKKAFRKKLIDRDGLRCRYCGISVVDGASSGPNSLVIEHMFKHRREDENSLCVACRRCNSQKGNLSVYEWLEKIDKQIESIKALEIIKNNLLEIIKAGWQNAGS